MRKHKKENVVTPELKKLTPEEIERIKTSWAIPNEKVVMITFVLLVK